MIRRALLALVLLTFGAPLWALGIPPKPTAWIVDNAGILDDAQEQAINEKCEAFFKASKASLVTITFPSLEGEELVDYTNRVVNAWNVKGDRIAILFIFIKDRKLWIQTGYGLEGEVTDAFASDVYRNTLVPAFKEQRYYDGINQALDQLAKKIDPAFQPPAPAASGNSPLGAPRPLPGASSGGGDDGSNAQFLIFIAFMFVVFILPMFLRRRGRRGGGCIGCIPLFPFGGGWGGGGTTFGGGGGGGSNWSIGGNWGGGGGSSFGGGGAGGGW